MLLESMSSPSRKFRSKLKEEYVLGFSWSLEKQSVEY